MMGNLNHSFIELPLETGRYHTDLYKKILLANEV